MQVWNAPEIEIRPLLTRADLNLRVRALSCFPSPACPLRNNDLAAQRMVNPHLQAVVLYGRLFNDSIWSPSYAPWCQPWKV